MKCYICEKGDLTKVKQAYRLYGEYLGDFEAETCSKCGEIFYNEETSRKMTEVAKARGLWGLNAESKIGQSGTTLDIRLPKKIIEFMNIKKGETVKIYPEDKRRLVVEL